MRGVRNWGGEELEASCSVTVWGVCLGALVAVWALRYDGQSRHEVIEVGHLEVRSTAEFWKWWGFYFIHNLRASFLVIAFGLLGRHPPLFLQGVDSASHGAFLVAVAILPGVHLGSTVLTMMPHAVVEFPAIILATAAAARISRVSRGSGPGGRLRTFANSWPVLLLLAGLFALASAIEVHSWTHARPGSAALREQTAP
jgi:uncharacterized membrane protein SpoIIM required for sporulation